MRHILIVGGTGMLREAAEHFIEQGNIVSLLARNESRLDALKQKYPERVGKILTLAQDYRDVDQAIESVKKAAGLYFYIDTAILWIHEDGGMFSEAVKQFLFKHYRKSRVWQVLGSASINPKEMSQTFWRELYPDRYREIFLGYQSNGSSTRWLTNREISEGTVRAVEHDAVETVIGKTDPWPF